MQTHRHASDGPTHNDSIYIISFLCYFSNCNAFHAPENKKVNYVLSVDKKSSSSNLRVSIFSDLY